MLRAGWSSAGPRAPGGAGAARVRGVQGGKGGRSRAVPQLGGSVTVQLAELIELSHE